MLRQLLDASRPVKRFISVVYDISALSFSLYMAWTLKLGSMNISPTAVDYLCLSITIVVSILAFVRLGLYRAILRYMAPDAVLSIILGILISSLTLAASSFFFQASIPRSVPVTYMITAVLLVGLPRLMVRNVVQMFFPIGDTKVLIYGAGSAGRLLADSLRQSKEYQPVAFLDDDLKLHNTRIKGLPVFLGNKVESLLKETEATHIFLALGAASRTTRLRIVRELERYPVQIQTIPPLEDLTKGRAGIDEIRDIQIEDLLGRDPVQPDPLLMSTSIVNKVVMVTGAGGSIGSELCKQILGQKPKVLILFELNEYNLYQIENELRSGESGQIGNTDIIALLGSVQDQQRLSMVMKNFKVDTVYHAAAYKHVTLVENNIIEGIQNNVFGTLNCAKAAVLTGVDTFVFISTDKAVRSTNIMGATKRLSELVVKTVSKQENSNTKFCMVRFGNVLGSSGSVVPKFKQQIKEGRAVTVTHPEITRYFMTIPEAAQLVIQAGALAKGGETYVLEMGEPVKIADLAREMIILSGLSVKDKNNPKGDIPIEYIGLRAGEKLFEELLISENVVGTRHARITEAIEADVPMTVVNKLIEDIDNACKDFDYESLFSLITSAPTVYSGSKAINDSLFNRRQSQASRELSLVKT